MERVKWIDTLRGIAILGVVFDHLFYLFSQLRSDFIWQHTFFSISWFVFLSGVANALSARKDKARTFPQSYFSFWKKRFTIIFPYIFASGVSSFVFNQSKVDMGRLIHEILFFSNQPIFYFINLLCQLYLVFPFLYSVINSTKKRWKKALLITVVFFFSYLLSFIYPPWPFSPAGRFFGGILLGVFFLGILYAEKKFLINRVVVWVISFIFVASEVFLLYTKGEFISRQPNFLLEVWSLSMLFVVKSAVDIIGQRNYIVLALNFLGRHSLFIYLFHFLLLALLSNVNLFRFTYWYEFIPAVLVTIFISIFMEYVYTFMRLLFYSLRNIFRSQR